MTQSRTLAQVVNRVDATETDTTTNATNITSNDVQLARGNNHGKNLIINGDFSVWQRGTSHTTEGYGSADRWFVGLSGATATLSQQSHTVGQTDVPYGGKYYAKYNVTTGDGNTSIRNRIEDVTITAGREVTVSFDAKGVNPGGGDITFATVQNFGTGGSPSTAIETNDITDFVLTASWQRFTYTFTVDSIAGKTLGTTENTSYFEVSLRQPTADAATDAWNIDISNVQLEFGDTATDFEYVKPSEQLANCQRYFERIVSGAADEVSISTGFAFSTTQAFLPLYFSEKRAKPTLTASGASVLSALDSASATSPWDISTFNDTGVQSSRLFSTRTAGTHAVADPFLFRLTAGTANYIDIDAEL